MDKQAKNKEYINMEMKHNSLDTEAFSVSHGFPLPHLSIMSRADLSYSSLFSSLDHSPSPKILSS